MILNEFIEFENSSRILDYRYQYKNIMIWPYVRDLLIRKVVLANYGLLPNVEGRGKEKKYRDYVKYNTFNLPKKDILFFSPSSALIESDSQIFDRLIDGFARVSERDSAKIIQYNQDFNFEKLEKMEIPYSLDTFINKIIAYEGSRNKVSNVEMQNINNFMEYIKKELPFDVEEGIYEAVKKQAIVVAKFFPAYYKYYKKLIDIVQPKLVIFHCGVYGLLSVKVFNDYKIVTAEYQHGSIDHQWPYMYGKQVAENIDYREHMPNYLLTWGDYWIRNINVPTEVYKIGNPEVQKNIDRLKKMKPNIDSRFNILFVTGNDYQWCVEFVSFLLGNLSEDYKIIIKLHPLLPDHICHYKKFLDTGRVEVINNGSIYDCLAVCKYVIGDMSTAMYEAAAMGKEVFIVDNNELTMACMNGDFGTLIHNGQEFIEKMNEERKKSFNSEDFFASNWKENYLKFLQDVL